jgi:hypothetical protein
MGMVHPSDRQQVVLALIRQQRKLAAFPNPLIRALTLLVTTKFDQQLSGCTDHGVANMTVAQERLPILEPEFAVCEHARQRLVGSMQASLLDEVHLLKAEVGLISSQLSAFVAPFSAQPIRQRFVYGAGVRKARTALMTAGFREHQWLKSLLVDADTDLPIRLIQER